jgi:predicted porin
MKSIFFTLSVLFFGLTSAAQMVTVKEKASGYLGKRLTIGVHMKASPSFQPQRAADYPRFISINKDMLFSLDYAVRNKRAIGISLGSARTSADLVATSEGDITIGNGKKLEVYQVNGNPDIRNSYAGLDYSWFRTTKGAIAPVGAYFKLGLLVHRYSIDQSAISVLAKENYYDDLNTYELNEKEYSFMAPEVQLGVGKTRVLFSGLLLDYGLDLALLASNLESYVIYRSNYNIEENIKAEINRRLVRRQIINVHLGLRFAL